MFAVNDPYLGGTHFNDVSIIRPIFVDDEIIAYAQSNGHWADVGGTRARLVRRHGEGALRRGAAHPAGPHLGQGPLPERRRHGSSCPTRGRRRTPRATSRRRPRPRAVCEREILRLVDKYSRDTIVTAFAEVQDYVENLTRTRIAELPDGVWETEDYLDSDPTLEEGLIPIKVRMEIEGDQIRYDLTGSHAAVGTFLNAGFGSAMSGVVGGTKTFFPEVPLNSGFYRAVDIDLGPEGTVVNAPWPVAVTGFCSGPYEKIMACAFEIWSQIMPERAIACSFNLEYLLVGGRDARSEDRPFFMWYDWMVGGWGGRNGRDGSNCTSPVFGVGLAVQPLEGQERLSPVLTSGHEILADSGGPGRFRGGCGVEKGGTLTQAERTVVSYCCDRARSITWGIEGGLPSSPHGVWLNKGTDDERFLGAIFSNVEIDEGDFFTRPSAGGGGYGDPLERDPDAVCEDVIDGYVTIDRALKDYGVVVEEIDAELVAVRGRRRGHRAGARRDRLRAQGVARGRPRGDRAPLPRGRARRARPGAPVRGHRRLGQRRAAAEHDASSSARWSSAAPPRSGRTSALDPLDAARERGATRLLRRPGCTRAAAVP